MARTDTRHVVPLTVDYGPSLQAPPILEARIRPQHVLGLFERICEQARQTHLDLSVARCGMQVYYGSDVFGEEWQPVRNPRLRQMKSGHVLYGHLEDGTDVASEPDGLKSLFSSVCLRLLQGDRRRQLVELMAPVFPRIVARTLEEVHRWGGDLHFLPSPEPIAADLTVESLTPLLVCPEDRVRQVALRFSHLIETARTSVR